MQQDRRLTIMYCTEYCTHGYCKKYFCKSTSTVTSNPVNQYRSTPSSPSLNPLRSTALSCSDMFLPSAVLCHRKTVELQSQEFDPAWILTEVESTSGELVEGKDAALALPGSSWRSRMEGIGPFPAPSTPSRYKYCTVLVRSELAWLQIGLAPPSAFLRVKQRCWLVETKECSKTSLSVAFA
jgi:hypothetical protein